MVAATKENESDSDVKTRKVVQVSAGGLQRVVEVEDLEGEAFVPDNDSNIAWIANDTYIDAHGPAEPVRGRYMYAEQTHPGIARASAMGMEPSTLPIIAPGATVPARVTDPAVTMSAADARETLENADAMPEDAEDAVSTDALGASQPIIQPVQDMSGFGDGAAKGEASAPAGNKSSDKSDGNKSSAKPEAGKGASNPNQSGSGI